MAYERFIEATFRASGFRLIPYSFEELELFPGCIASGTAHFEVDRFGTWKVERIKLEGFHGPDCEIDAHSTGDDAVIFRRIADTLHATREEKILGRCVEEV